MILAIQIVAALNHNLTDTRDLLKKYLIWCKSLEVRSYKIEICIKSRSNILRFETL